MNNQLRRCLFAGMIGLSLAACGATPEPEAEQNPNRSAKADSEKGKPGTHRALAMTVAHLNDTHTQIETLTGNLKLAGRDTQVSLGGHPRLVAKIASLRASASDLLVLHAGDAFQGSLYFTKYLGLADLEFFQMMPLDAMVVGNHEFDRGPAVLAAFVDAADFPVLGANVDAGADADLAGDLVPYTVKLVDGEKVAIIGLTTAEIATISSPGHTLTFGEPVAKAQQLVTEIEAMGINKIVALTHIGYEQDLALAQAVEGIDLIIGGHSHSLQGDPDALEALQANPAYGGIPLTPDDVYPKMVQGPGSAKVCVAHAWSRTKALGLLQIEVDEDGFVTACQGNPLMLVGETFKRFNPATRQLEEVTGQDKTDILTQIDGSPAIEVVAEDDVALAALAPLKSGVDELLAQKIADVTENLVHVYIPGLHWQTSVDYPKGSLLAPHLAESLLAKLRANGIDAQMTVINAGSVRKDLVAGDLSVGDVYEMCPYENTLVALKLTGQQIKDQLEQAVAGAHENPSEGTGRRFPYVGGLRYTADMTESENQRITSIEVRTGSTWETLDLAASYVVGTVSFLARGGDGYDVFREAMGSRYDSGFIDAEAFVDYAEANTPLSQPEDTGITYIPPPS